jgi:hypothetical protein
MNEQRLMQTIKTKWGELLAAQARNSSLPESFFAALIANESGGDPTVKRFEAHVFGALGEVVNGRKPAYGSIGAEDILAFVVPDNAPSSAGDPVALRFAFSAYLQRFSYLAFSWGLTQVMGYEAIPFRLDGIAGLQEPASSLAITLQMLNQFAYHNALDVKKDFSELFTCWNTGRPHAPTADPKYVPNGLARMKVYEALTTSDQITHA